MAMQGLVVLMAITAVLLAYAMVDAYRKDNKKAGFRLMLSATGSVVVLSHLTDLGSFSISSEVFSTNCNSGILPRITVHVPK